MCLASLSCCWRTVADALRLHIAAGRQAPYHMLGASPCLAEQISPSMSVWIVPSALQHMPWASMTCACHALHTTDLCRAHVCDSSAAGAGGMPHIGSAQSRHGSRNARRCAGRWSRARLQSQAHGLPFCGVLVSCRAMPVNIAQTHRCAHGEAGSGFSGGLTCNSFPEPCRSRYGAGGKDWRQGRHGMSGMPRQPRQTIVQAGPG